MYGLAWIPTFLTSQAIRQWKSRPNRLRGDDKKIGIHAKPWTILFLPCYFMFWTHSSATNTYRSIISTLSPRTFLFPTEHCDVVTVDLWRHTNGRYCHCGVIPVDCSCTRKLDRFLVVICILRKKIRHCHYKDQKCKITWLRSLLFRGLIDLDLQGQM